MSEASGTALAAGLFRLHRRLAPCRSVGHPTQMAESRNSLPVGWTPRPSELIQKNRTDGRGVHPTLRVRELVPPASLTHLHWNNPRSSA